MPTFRLHHLAACAVAAASLGAAVPAFGDEPTCLPLTEPDRAIVAMLPRQLIESVTPLVDEPTLMPPTAGDRATLAGATVTVSPVPGLSAERLQRIVECGLATAGKPGASDWLHLPAGVKPSVRSGGDGFLVDFRARNERDAKTTLATLQQLAPAAGSASPR